MQKGHQNLAIRMATLFLVMSILAPLSTDVGLAQAQPSDTVPQTPAASLAEILEELTPQNRAIVLESITRQGSNNFWLMVIFVVFIGLLSAAIFFYTFRLHVNFLKICADNNQVALFAQAPAGLPVGTIRSLIAFFIVITAIFLILFTLKGGPFAGFPEVLGGVLGTVLGFYFGSRTASSAGERATTLEMSQLTEQRNQAIVRAETTEQRNQAMMQAEATRLDRTLETVKEGLIVASTIKDVLPDGLRKSADVVIGKVQGGVKTVEALKSSGNVGEAVEKAIGLAKDVSSSGGIATLLAKSVGSFGVALGGAVPPLSLAISVATIAARLSGAAYERWIARVLDAPYTPALFPPTVIDANTGLVLLRKSPQLATAFADEIQQGNRAFVLEFVQTALSEVGSEAIRDKYVGRFATLQEIDEALNQFQQAAIELEVSKDITHEMASDVGGVEPLMRALDRINANPEARADMDALMLMVDKLRQAGQPVEQLMREALQEVEG